MSLQTHLRSEVASVPLTYSIADCSAHSGRYVAENILVDKSGDQSSRWSGAYQGYAKQWILLQLDNPAVLSELSLTCNVSPALTGLPCVESITFGKVRFIVLIL